MADVVLDATAILALMFEEPGCDEVEAQLPGSIVSAVNVSEVATRLLSLDTPDETVEIAIKSLQLRIQPFDMDQAMAAAGLREVTRSAGLSPGDRACLALAKTRQMNVLTADQVWKNVADEAGINVVVIG